MKRECQPDEAINMKRHDKTGPVEATTIQRYSESKFVNFILSFPFSLSAQFLVTMGGSCSQEHTKT